MASIEPTATGFAVKWRLGGKRTGAPQTLTFRIPPGHNPAPTRKLAEVAKQLVESRSGAITRDQVRLAVLGDQPDAPTGIPTFAEWIDMYLERRGRSADAQKDTLARYRQILYKRALPFLGHLRLTEITPDVLTDWVAWIIKNHRRRGGFPLSGETVRRAHAIVHGCLGAAVPRYLSANPAARPVGARKHTSGLPQHIPFEGMFLEPWEVDSILGSCSPSIRDIVDVDVRTGLRLGELVVLRVRDVVIDGRRPHIKVVRALKDDGTIGPPKSAASRREVNITGSTIEVLMPRVAGKRANDLIFPAPMGGIWHKNNLRVRHWQPAVAYSQRCDEHPPPLPSKPVRGPRRKLRFDEVSTCTCRARLKRTPRFHDLRHTAVSLCIEAGMSPKQVQRRMGHARYEITMNIYGHLWEHSGMDRLPDIDRLLASAVEDEDD